MKITERRLRSLIREEAQVILEGKRDFVRPKLRPVEGKIIKNPTRESLAFELFPNLWSKTADGRAMRWRPGLENLVSDEEKHFVPQELEFFYDSLKNFGATSGDRQFNIKNDLKNWGEIEVFPRKEGERARFRWWQAAIAPLMPVKIEIGGSLPPVAYQWEASLVQVAGREGLWPLWFWNTDLVDGDSATYLDKLFTGGDNTESSRYSMRYLAPVTRKEIEEAYDLMLDNPEHRERGIFSRIMGKPLDIKQEIAMKERIWKIANEFARKHDAPVRKIQGL